MFIEKIASLTPACRRYATNHRNRLRTYGTLESCLPRYLQTLGRYATMLIANLLSVSKFYVDVRVHNDCTFANTAYYNMANTYTQIYIQTVFAVKHRYGLINIEWKGNLYQYITGIVQNQGHKLIVINGMPDHVHAFIGLNPKQSVSELMQYLKMDSAKWINEKKLVPSKFEWQSGYGAFSYGHSQIDSVVKYIQNQEEHHRKRTFLEEYAAFLQKFNVPYDERYVFQPIND